MIEPVFNATLMIFFLIILGGFLRWTRVLRPEADRSTMSLCINVLYPCLIFSKIMATPLRENLVAYGILPIFGFCSVLVAMVILHFFTSLPKAVTGLENDAQRRTFLCTSALYNYGYVPIPIIQFMYPEKPEYATALFIFILGIELSVWLCVVPWIAGGLQKGWWKKVLSVPFLTIFLAAFLNLAGFRMGVDGNIPQCIGKTIEHIGLAQITMPLIFIGAMIYDQLAQRHVNFSSFRTYQVMGWTLFFRAFFFPCLMILTALMMPGNPLLQRILVIQAAMPTAMLIIMFTQLYGGCSSVATIAIMTTNLLTPIIAVFWIVLGMHLLERFPGGIVAFF
ncbi:MAG: AEC family transporter [Planctomycetia bacterium]|nr:AEC family transporter [Planctomycetia bacterium]